MTDNGLKLDNLLCFVHRARNTLSEYELIRSCTYFYDQATVERSKATIYDLLNVAAPNRRGSKTKSKSQADIEDILAAFDTGERDNFSWPCFVSNGPYDLPPTLGFFRIADTLQGLHDEIAQLKEQVKVLSTQKSSPDANALKEIRDDLQYIKSSMRKTPQISEIEAPVPAVAGPSTAQLTSQNGNFIRDTPSFAEKAAAPAVIDKAPKDQSRPPRRSSVKKPPAPKEDPKTVQYTVVTNKRKYTKVIGNGKNNIFFSGTERLVDLYIGGCKTETTPQNILDHCKHELEVIAKDCTELKSNYNYYKAFKLKIRLQDRPKLLNPDHWPEDTFVNKFYKPRTSSD